MCEKVSSTCVIAGRSVLKSLKICSKCIVNKQLAVTTSANVSIITNAEMEKTSRCSNCGVGYGRIGGWVITNDCPDCQSRWQSQGQCLAGKSARDRLRNGAIAASAMKKPSSITTNCITMM